MKKIPALVPVGWALVLRGAVAVAIGSLSLTARDLSLASVTTLVAAYALSDGCMTLLGTLRTTRANERWWPLLLEGLVGLGLGAQALLWPGFDEGTLLYYVALWSLVSGALELSAAWRLHEEIAGEYLLALRGLTAIGLSALLVFGERGGGAGLLFWLGPSAILFGILFVALGLRLHAWNTLPKYDAQRRIYVARRQRRPRPAPAARLPYVQGALPGVTGAVLGGGGRTSPRRLLRARRLASTLCPRRSSPGPRAARSKRSVRSTAAYDGRTRSPGENRSPFDSPDLVIALPRRRGFLRPGRQSLSPLEWSFEKSWGGTRFLFDNNQVNT